MIRGKYTKLLYITHCGSFRLRDVYIICYMIELGFTNTNYFHNKKVFKIFR